MEGLNKNHENPHGQDFKIRAHLTVIFKKEKRGPSSVATHDSLGTFEFSHINDCKLFFTHGHSL